MNRSDLAIARVECDNDLLFFTRFFYKQLRGSKFITNWHHREICDNLHRLTNYELEFLGINIPPRHSKTELAGINLIARGIGMNPRANFLYITASDELRSETSVRIRDIVSHPYFKQMYGVELKKDQNGKNLWRTSQGGGLKTATIFGQITGFGAGQMIDTSELEDYIRDFEGCIVLDDINKTDDSEVQNANNEKVTRVIFNTIMSRKNSKDTPIINIQQRAGMQDATAQFMDYYGVDNPKAKFLVLPVIKDGKPLWEFMMNMEAIEKQRTHHKTAHMFQSQYMQEPQTKEGLLFAKEDLNYFNGDISEKGDPESISGYIDVADTGKDSHSIPIGYLIDGRIYIPDVLFTKLDHTKNVDLSAAILNEHNPEYVRVESNGVGAMYISALTPKLKDTITLLPIRSKTKKHTRIINASYFIKKFFVFRNDYKQGSDYDLFMTEITGYLKDGSSDNDDAPDSIEGLAKLFQSFYPHIWASEEIPE